MPAASPKLNFIVLRYDGTIPAMAGCQKCKRKFFTPATYSHDAFGAQEYLRSKFDHHNCEEPPKQRITALAVTDLSR